MAVSKKVYVLPEQHLPERKPLVMGDRADQFFNWYNKFESVGVRLPKVKFVERRFRNSFPDDGILRIDDEGNIRIGFEGHGPVIIGDKFLPVTQVEFLIAWKALQDAGILYEHRCRYGDNPELAHELARAFMTLSTDPD